MHVPLTNSPTLPLFRTVFWFALVTGIVEGISRVVQLRIFGEPAANGRNVVWTAAVCDVALFLAITLLYWLCARAWPALVKPRAVGFWSLFLFFTGLLSNVRNLYLVAVLILATGLAWQGSQLLVRFADPFLRAVRWSSIPMALLVIFVAFGMVTWREVRERKALAALPPAREGAPNVLLIVLDTVRAESMSLYGHERETTPNIARLASRGVVFDRAYATAPWTLPSHASMFTGRYHHELDVGWRKALDARWPTLAEAFRERGYATGGMVGNLLYCTSWTGLARGFDHYDDIALFSLPHWLANCGLGRQVMVMLNRSSVAWMQRMVGSSKSGEKVAGEFLDWQASIGERPFFAFVNFMDAHDPYDPPRPYDTRFSETPVGRVRQEEEQRVLDPASLDLSRVAYDSQIAHVDALVATLLHELEDRGALENTLVVITSDHGEQFGEHGLVLHANSLYSQLLHVPLVVVYPARVPAGERVSSPVSLRDLAATLVDLSGLEVATPFPGVSLQGLWNEGGAPAPSPCLAHLTKALNRPEWYPNGPGPMDSIVSGSHHYIRDARGAEQLFDVQADPAETQDISATDGGREAVSRLRAATPNGS
jgi:arylsulfatase A-like enzyme